jgi:ADP-dependent NAD(P)H-hydrate dehydratase / NAD(P)H-hydrate epimerase
MTTSMPVAGRDVYGRANVALLTAAEAAAADRCARERFSIPEGVLMETAGRAAALVLQRLHPHGRVVGVAGSGNNGGDLLVMLRVLQEWGREVAVVAVGRTAPDRSLAHGSDVAIIESEDAAMAALAGAAVIVDGILGTGSNGAPHGRVADWIDRINAAGRPVLALDLPSGVDASAGRVEGRAVTADTTVTFGWPKVGLLLQPARRSCGRLIAVEIGFPAACASPEAWAITPGWASQALPRREPDAHKGSVGRLLVLAGSTGMAGAAALAGEAALRAGVGLLRFASSAENRVVLQTLVPEATFLDRTSLEVDDVASMHALVAGPGMGTTADARAALVRALELTGDAPVLLDADALNMLAVAVGDLERISAARPVVITPHALELARLNGDPLHTIVTDPPAAARAAARRFGCVVLLKGQPSVVAAPEGALLVNTVGSSDLAAAGMGDQLAGTAGAMLAGGCDPLTAAALGLFLSGRAADIAGLGASLTPRDVSAHLAAALADTGPDESNLALPFITFDQPVRW